jgi:hypothetical protein
VERSHLAHWGQEAFMTVHVIARPSVTDEDGPLHLAISIDRDAGAKRRRLAKGVQTYGRTADQIVLSSWVVSLAGAWTGCSAVKFSPTRRPHDQTSSAS